MPEIGGKVDPGSDTHDLVMSLYGGMSKGERNRIKVRVRSAMAAQAHNEGRFLGGRPPYGYQLADAGAHPNPGKAADGKRLHQLEVDGSAAPVVERIFAEYIAGRGYFAIAQDLTRDGIPSPSAHDPARNRHRDMRSWSKIAVRSILMNPKYVGRQVWNRQRRDEILVDVEDVARVICPECGGTMTPTGSGRPSRPTRPSSALRTSPRLSRRWRQAVTGRPRSRRER